MKVFLIFFLSISLFLFAAANTYSQDLIYAHERLFSSKYLNLTEQVSDFDDYIFLQDEHIERIEYIPEDHIVKNNILYSGDPPKS